MKNGSCTPLDSKAFTVVLLGSNWRAPCKPAPNDYFVSIFQVAPNRLKFGMSTLCVLKNVPVGFFFKNAETSGQNCVKFPPPPPPSLSISKQRRISIFEGQNTVHVSFTLLVGDWGGGGGGGATFKNVFEALLPRLWKKKKHRDIF